MLRRPLRYAYEKLGPRYPRWAIWVQFQFAYVVVLGGVGLLTLYVNLDSSSFWQILLVGWFFVLIENLVSLKVVNKLLRPADPWLRGARTPETALAAWRAFAGLPIDFLRHRRALVVVGNVVPISIFVTLELDKAFFPAFLIVCVTASIVLLYGILLRFFALELVMSPLLEETSCELPDDTELKDITVPLRTRLLVALPAINVITGVVVAGFAAPHNSLGSLGAGVLLAIAVAFTISLELSLLLTRSIVEPLEDLRIATQRVRGGDLDARVPVLGTDETGLLAASFNGMVSGLREREQLREAFGAFVDPALADRVLQEGTILRGEEVDVTVLFLDIRGFTAFAERAGAAEAVARLNEFYELVVPIIVEHGGHANKFVGDGLLAVFGAPDTLPDHADRCVAASLAIARRVEAEQGGRVSIGIGVNSGDVVAGTVGGGGRVEFTVIGDVVNTAARVEEATRQTGDVILVTAATRDLLREDHGGLAQFYDRTDPDRVG
ncbi:MAG: adenylate/guanylate cyclase domain-containing protein [Actinobacteria bacterium]|nr:MAG: adenylate/guanylate cyclase domain-containing protein [Actinomycetota bacterium]